MKKIMFKKRKAMTLAALLVIMLVTSSLVAMFVPVLVQGLVEITTGKAEDGKVNLSRNSGYFLCYYNNAGVLTQVRADIAPNGRATISTTAAAGGCNFVIPQDAAEYKFTLIGGGGGGAKPTFSNREEIAKNDEGIEKQYTLSPSGAKYSFSIDKDTEEWKSKLLNQVWTGTNSYACVKGCKITINSFLRDLGADDPSVPYSIYFKDNVFTYQTVDGSWNPTSVTLGENCSVVGTAAVGLVSTALSGTCTAADFKVNGVNLTNTQSIVLSVRQKIFEVGQAGGGESGQLVEQTVSFLDENVANTNTFRITPDWIGKGGAQGANGTATTLRLPGSTAVITAQGGKAGSLKNINIAQLDPSSNNIPANVYAGDNGSYENFVPVTFNITDLAQGIGSSDVATTPVAATYPGAGGGGGAIGLTAIDKTTYCLNGRSGFTIGGSFRNLDCTPAALPAGTSQIGNGGKGANGAILIAW